MNGTVILIIIVAIIMVGGFCLFDSENVASWFGNCIGGICTLIAVYLTTQQTSKIQNENKRIAMEDWKNHRTEIMNNAKRQEKMELRKERIRFCDDIAMLIGQYSSDISAYYYDCHSCNDEKTKNANRKTAIECFFVINIKLKNIDGDYATKLISALEDVHKLSSNESINYKQFQDELNILHDITVEFIKKYKDCDW